MDPDAWAQTVEVATTQIPELEGAEISDDVYDSSFAEAAVAALEEEGLDVRGEDFEKAEVELAEGGE